MIISKYAIFLFYYLSVFCVCSPNNILFFPSLLDLPVFLRDHSPLNTFWKNQALLRSQIKLTFPKCLLAMMRTTMR